MFKLFKDVVVVSTDIGYRDIDYDIKDLNECLKDKDLDSLFLDLFNKEKLYIIKMNHMDYANFMIRYYKFIMPNINFNIAYDLYEMSLSNQYELKNKSLTLLEFNILYEQVEKFDLSIMNKIYPTLPIEFFIATYLSGERNQIIREKIKEYICDYVSCMYERVYKKNFKCYPNIHELKIADYKNLREKLKEVKKEDIIIDEKNIKEIVSEIKNTLYKVDISNKILKSIEKNLSKGNFVKIFEEEINQIKNNKHEMLMIEETNNFDFFNRYVIYYIYTLYMENKKEDLYRMSLNGISN